ncbi:hypothetical protein PTKIN_Ptkin02bG0033000 [Pterospermum kingtungense]
MKNSDIISNLPDNITEQILARLSIRDAVRTSVLSRNWRYRWTTIPHLVFDTHHSTNPALDLDGDKLVKFLAQGSVKKLLPSTFKNLYYINFHGLKYEETDSLSSVLGLITSSPNLTKLVVKTRRATTIGATMMWKTVAEFLAGESRSIGCLMKLRYVEMKNIVGIGPEMELMKLILGKSPSLEHMKIDLLEFLYIEEKSKILKGLIRFPRASKIAKIIHQGREQI